MLIRVDNLSKIYPIERGWFRPACAAIAAVDSVSFEVEKEATLGIVGESGSGKTTLAKMLLNLIMPTQGAVIFDPAYVTNFRKDVQIVFQNPYASLNPKMRIGQILSEPLIIHKIAVKDEAEQRCRELLQLVGLDETALSRYPGQFSGGQRQRICLARALACGPKVLVLDEPLSSLDLTVQATLLELLLQLKLTMGLTYIFISHNLAVIKHIADSVLVMREGKIVERGSADQIFAVARHPYTQRLLAAARA